MGAQKSVHAGKAKIDFNVDFTHKLRDALMLHPSRDLSSPLSLIIGSLCIKHPNLFGKSEKLDVLCDKGLSHSSVSIIYRSQWPQGFPQQSFAIQHSVSPEIAVHGVPVENYSRSGSGGVNLCRFNAGLDMHEREPDPTNLNVSSYTNVKFEHVRPVNDDGNPIARDLHGFPVTCSGGRYDNLAVWKHELRFAKASDHSFSSFNWQMEQGAHLLSKWLGFARFKFVASKGVQLGPAQLSTSLTGGYIVGDIAPYQAFAIGGVGSVRGYGEGEGAVGSGVSCLIANSELTFHWNKMIEAVLFLDCGTDLGSAHHVPGNPSLRHGKPGTGLGIGCTIRLKSQMGQLQANYAINAFRQTNFSFGFDTSL